MTTPTIVAIPSVRAVSYEEGLAIRELHRVTVQESRLADAESGRLSRLARWQTVPIPSRTNSEPGSR